MRGVSKHRKQNPMKAKLILAFYALMSCVVRVTAIIVYFAVPLGLFDLLRHLQGSQDFYYFWLFKANLQLLCQFMCIKEDVNIVGNRYIHFKKKSSDPWYLLSWASTISVYLQWNRLLWWKCCSIHQRDENSTWKLEKTCYWN